MPIYEYRCEACGHQEEHLQKFSEPALSLCPGCGKASYKKQLSAAGFQLKGSGWYATDFKSPARKPAPSGADAKAGEKSGDTASSDKPGDAKPETKTETKTETKPAPKSEATA
jgi:putative FmdB family regulatory protein